MKISPISSAACLLIAAVVGQARSEIKSSSGEFGLDTSLVYASGDYGLDTTTEVWVGLLSPAYESKTWRLQASVPYLRLTGPASVVGNVSSTTASTNRTENGLGDASISLTRKFDAAQRGFLFEFGGKVKFPTGAEVKGLGTGETDASLQFDAYKVGWRVTPFVSVGYQYLGKSEAYPMKSGPFASIGVVYPVAETTTLGAVASWKARMVEDGDASVDAMLFIQRNLNDRVRLQLFVMKGFTDASPTLCAGLTAGLKF